MMSRLAGHRLLPQSIQSIRKMTDLQNKSLSYSTFDGIHPVIDVSPLLTKDHPGRSDTISDIGSALKQRGYFYAQNVSVLSADYLNFIYDYSERLHSLPVDIKRQYSQRDGYGAYSGMDIGQPELAYDTGTIASVHAWDYSRTQFTLKNDDTANDSCDAEVNNRYPGADILDPPYEQVLDDLYERQNVLGRALMMAFAECLDLPPDTFVNMFDGETTAADPDQPKSSKDGDFGTIRLLYYPGMDSTLLDQANIGISAHTDFEAFTLMHQSAPGLQFLPASRDNGGTWVDAPVRPQEFVVVVGDALERCTNGVLRATPHRVVKTSHPRRSIIRFNAFAPDTMIEPLAAFVTKDRPAAYSPVSMKVHMETTMKNLEAGLGAWDNLTQTSLTANYLYVDGKDHRGKQ